MWFQTNSRLLLIISSEEVVWSEIEMTNLFLMNYSVINHFRNCTIIQSLGNIPEDVCKFIFRIRLLDVIYSLWIWIYLRDALMGGHRSFLQFFPDTVQSRTTLQLDIIPEIKHYRGSQMPRDFERHRIGGDWGGQSVLKSRCDRMHTQFRDHGIKTSHLTVFGFSCFLQVCR